MKAMGYPHQHTLLDQMRCEADLNWTHETKNPRNRHLRPITIVSPSHSASEIGHAEPHQNALEGFFWQA